MDSFTGNTPTDLDKEITKHLGYNQGRVEQMDDRAEDSLGETYGLIT